MRRREFIASLSAAAALRASNARAQQNGRLPTIGFLAAGTVSRYGQWIAAFTRRLHELGWDEGRTIAIEYRFSDGRNDRDAEFASEFARLKVDIIVTVGGATLAAKQATSSIPIVFAVATDPLAGGLVTSLAHPGGNVTGSSLESSDLAGKRLEFLHAVLPNLRRLAVIANSTYPATMQEMHEVEAGARTLGFEALAFPIKQAADIAPAFDAFKDRADALYVVGDPLTSSSHVRINTLALGARLPTMLGYHELVEAGGLMSYGPNFSDLFRRAAEITDKILRGTKPGDIPVEQPTKFELIVNLTTARALGLKIPESFLSLADEVIE